MLGRNWPGPGEPLFTPEDTQLALEWQAEADLICGGCGHPIDESMDPDNEDAYVAHVNVCAACAAKERKQAATPEEALIGAYIYADMATEFEDDEATTP